jgi:predicted DNA-binding protein
MTRVFDHKIRRIIDHCTYNTETATEIAGSADKALFKTRERGDYFIAVYLHEFRFEGIQPVTFEQAKSWLGEFFPECELQLLTDLLDLPSESRTTLRMPSNLKLRIDALAKRRGQSVNAWIVRCLETGVSDEEEVAHNEFYSRSQSRIKGMKEEMKEIANERRTRP